MSPFTPAVRSVTLAACALLVLACNSADGRQLDTPSKPLPVPAAPETTIPTGTIFEPVMLLFAPWRSGAMIPAEYTCDGPGSSPMLSWADVPADAVELAITVTGIDDAEGVYWILYAIDPSVTRVDSDEIPEGAFEWTNSFGDEGWTGPCGLAGQSHEYEVTLYALGQQLEVDEGASPAEVLSSIEAFALAETSLIGTYRRG